MAEWENEKAKENTGGMALCDTGVITQHFIPCGKRRTDFQYHTDLFIRA